MRGKKPRIYNSHRQGTPDESVPRYTIRRVDTGQFYAGEQDGALWEASIEHASKYDTIGDATAAKQMLLRLGLPVYVAYNGKRIP